VGEAGAQERWDGRALEEALHDDRLGAGATVNPGEAALVVRRERAH